MRTANLIKKHKTCILYMLDRGCYSKETKGSKTDQINSGGQVTQERSGTHEQEQDGEREGKKARF